MKILIHTLWELLKTLVTIILLASAGATFTFFFFQLPDFILDTIAILVLILMAVAFVGVSYLNAIDKIEEKKNKK